VRNPSEKEVDIIFLILLFKGFFGQNGEMSCLFLPCTVSWDHLPPRKNGKTQTKEIFHKQNLPYHVGTVSGKK